MTAPKDQLYLDDDMRPADDPDVPEIRDAIRAWLDAKEEQVRASENTKAAADAALLKLKEHKLESHPYTDPKSGKRRHFVADTTPKPKTMAWPKSRDREDDVGEEVERPDPAKVFAEEQDAKKQKKADKVESRRVSRASVEAEIDPFASTRKSMETEH